MNIFRNNSSSKHASSAGFTIIELMIATMVFSVILVTITLGVISFTNAYYKGINSSSTQNTTRSAIDTLSQAIQYNGGNPTQNAINATHGIICIGTSQEFDYILGNELPTGTGALYQKAVSACSQTQSFTGGKELLQAKMRLAYIKLSSVPASTTLHTLDIKIAYGDDDLLCSPSLNGHPGGCNSGDATKTGISGADLRCKQTTGSQFCYVSELSTTVQQRVQ